MAEQVQNTDREKKSSTKIPVISTALKIALKTLSLSIFAGFALLLLEIVLYAITDHPIEAAFKRYAGVSQFVSGTWFDEAETAREVEQVIASMLDVKAIADTVNSGTNTAIYYLHNLPTYGNFHASVMDLIIKVVATVPDLYTIWLVTTFTWLAKVLSIIALVLPCGIILGGGFVDGTVERKINTFKGKRDSQDKIEWWFLFFKSSSYTVLFLYIALPNSMSAATIMFPAAVISSFFLRNVVANYKKYM